MEARSLRSDGRVARGVEVGLWVVSGIGYLFGAYVLLVVSRESLSLVNGGYVDAGGAAGWDAASTWLAGVHLRAGEPVYAIGPNPGIGQIYYPPIFVQLAAPLSFLPWPAFSALARLAEFLALRGVTGSWRATGVWLLFLPVVMEINIANVVLLAALGTSLALRGRPGFLPLAALPKLAPILALPATWQLAPNGRRTLLVVGTAVAIAVGVSFALDPGLWSAWVDAVRRLREYGDAGTQQGFDSGFFPRLGLALALAGLSAWRGWPIPRTTAFIATLVGLPALRDASFAMLAGVPLLLRVDLDSRGATAAGPARTVRTGYTGGSAPPR
jgi:hypothetical protein